MNKKKFLVLSCVSCLFVSLAIAGCDNVGGLSEKDISYCNSVGIKKLEDCQTIILKFRKCGEIGKGVVSGDISVLDLEYGKCQTIHDKLVLSGVAPNEIKRLFGN